jgi:hypothetical protein
MAETNEKDQFTDLGSELVLKWDRKGSPCEGVCPSFGRSRFIATRSSPKAIIVLFFFASSDHIRTL